MMQPKIYIILYYCLVDGVKLMLIWKDGFFESKIQAEKRADELNAATIFDTHYSVETLDRLVHNYD